MSKVCIIVVIYNGKKYIEPVFGSIFAQTFKNFQVLAVINGNDDGSEQFIRQKFPKVGIINPNQNLGFAKGNNLAIAQSEGEFIQLVNQDVILEKDYVQQLLSVFDNPQVAAASGKLLRYDFVNNKKTTIIDSTGILMSSSGRARDRGQLEQDQGQYDSDLFVFGVSGAAPMYRREFLEKIKFCENKRCEYFDEDFMAYWEDVDLSWRFARKGFKNVYVPQAVGYHGRTAGQSEGGYLHLINFIKHHQKLPESVKKQNYRNHILMYIKNSPYIHPMFVLRELAMFFFILIFETRTLSVIPQIFKLVPKMRKKRINL